MDTDATSPPDAVARLREAAQTAVNREKRLESPAGAWQDRLWFPAPEERRDCCEPIVPTETNRQALESHCRTLKHVAALYGVPSSALRQAIRRAGGRHKPSVVGRGSPSPVLEAKAGAHFRDVFRDLQDEAGRFRPILATLCGAEPAEGLSELLAEADARLEALRRTLTYCLALARAEQLLRGQSS